MIAELMHHTITVPVWLVLVLVFAGLAQIIMLLHFGRYVSKLFAIYSELRMSLPHVTHDIPRKR